MPLPVDPRDPRDWLENSGRLYSTRRRVQIDTFARPIFDKSEKIGLGTPRRPQGPPRDPQGIPKGPPRDALGIPWGPQAAQVQQKESQVGAKIAKGTPKPVQGQPKQAKRTDYINKLPINRLRGRYVIIILII